MLAHFELGFDRAERPLAVLRSPEGQLFLPFWALQEAAGAPARPRGPSVAKARLDVEEAPWR